MKSRITVEDKGWFSDSFQLMNNCKTIKDNKCKIWKVIRV